MFHIMDKNDDNHTVRRNGDTYELMVIATRTDAAGQNNKWIAWVPFVEYQPTMETAELAEYAATTQRRLSRATVQ